jgi:DNA polymerase III epsilon subunit-like protein
MSGDILVWDTETTGLTLHPDADPFKQPKIIEFGGILLSRVDGSILSEHTWFVQPGVALDADIQRITGLKDEDLYTAQRFGACVQRFADVFSKASAMVAHNLPFDRAVLRGELVRNNIADFPWPRGEFCTVSLYRDEFGFNPKLINLYEAKLGRPLAQTHRALDDVKALVEIVQHERLWEIM